MGLGKYVPATSSEQQEMLKTLGLSSLDDLYVDVPQDLKVTELNIPAKQSELEVRRHLTELADKNTVFSSVFRGAGAYNHYIPSLVKQIAGKEEFMTAYTPYQAEISQGILQSIFEFQTMICELTGMDAANASVYDGASAAGEAVNMVVGRKKNKVLVASTLHPMTIETIKTYAYGSDVEIELIPEVNGRIDQAALTTLLTKEVAGVLVQQPNYYGLMEEATEIGEQVHQNKSQYILSVNPMAAALTKTAREYGADIAIGEGQPLGLPMSFGGPYLGFMATTDKNLRSLPGRIVGETEDVEGNRAYVLTLQAREQHIRREKAKSNICSNQALCALTASIYMTVMGPKGLQDAAYQSYAKAHYLAEQLTEIPGFDRVYPGEFFHEFVTTCPVPAKELTEQLAKHGILGGLELENGLLWCATEMNTKEQMDELIAVIKEVCQ